jgi:hypothetical protein
MKDNGIIIEKHDPQPEVRRNAEAARDWEFAEEARRLYRRAVLFKERLLDPVLLTTRSVLADPVISFENMRNNKVLAAYTLRRNPQGLLYEITMNTQQYIAENKKPVWQYGEWAQMECLLHEQIHLWQQTVGKVPFTPGHSQHNKEFIKKAKSLGLNVTPEIGCHFAVADEDSPFGILMRELGIDRPTDVPRADPKIAWFDTNDRKGKSTLSKWSCGCQNVRVGTKEFFAHCDVCGNPFIKVESKAQAMLGMVVPPEEPQKPKFTKEQIEFAEWSMAQEQEMDRRRDEKMIEEAYGAEEPDDYPNPYD